MKKLGFTLSEILIALVLIGVLAAILIPPIMNKTNEQEFRTSAKKAISGLDKAVALEYAMEGMTVQDYTSSEELVKYLFKKRMNSIEPSAKKFTNNQCEDASPDSIFNTADGMIYCVTNFQSDYSEEKGSKCDFYNTTPCTKEDGPNIWIDVNGNRKPNKATTSAKKPRDIYQAQLYSQKVIAFGEPTQGIFYNKDYENEKDRNKGKNNSNSDNIYDEPTNDNETPVTPNIPAEPTEPEIPQNPDKPTPEQPQTPNEGDLNFEDENQDINNPYYDQYDPKKWPSWLDFLRWLWDFLIGLIT